MNRKDRTYWIMLAAGVISLVVAVFMGAWELDPPPRLANFLTGFGCSYIVMAALMIWRRRDPAVRKQLDVEAYDERNISIRIRSGNIAYYVMEAYLFILIMYNVANDNRLLVQILASIAFIGAITQSLAYVYYKNKT